MTVLVLRFRWIYITLVTVVGIWIVTTSILHTNLNSSAKTKRTVIGIDPGHGGIDSGARFGNVLEKDINLIFSQKLAAEMQKRGYQVYLTRNTDRLLTPYAHYQYKNRPYKRDDLLRRITKLEKAGASIILSIHVNWHRSTYHRGPLTYYSVFSTSSQRLARNIQDRFNQIQPYRKIPRPIDSFLLKKAKIPTIIVEIGFISNAEDRLLLTGEEYQKRLISGIIDGVDKSGFSALSVTTR